MRKKLVGVIILSPQMRVPCVCVYQDIVVVCSVESIKKGQLKPPCQDNECALCKEGLSLFCYNNNILVFSKSECFAHPLFKNLENIGLFPNKRQELSM